MANSKMVWLCVLKESGRSDQHILTTSKKKLGEQVLPIANMYATPDAVKKLNTFFRGKDTRINVSFKSEKHDKSIRAELLKLSLS